MDYHRALRSERIDAKALVDSVCERLRPLLRHHGAELRRKAPRGVLAPVYGDAVALGSAVRVVLRSLVDGRLAGDRVEIELMPAGSRLLLVGRAVVRAEPPATPRRRARRARQLARCAEIVAAHGGELREETEHSIRELQVDLPAGAPHGPHDPALAVIQEAVAEAEIGELRRRAAVRRQAARSLLPGAAP